MATNIRTLSSYSKPPAAASPAQPLNEIVSVLPCNHPFAKASIITCLASNQPCPACSKPIEGFVPFYTKGGSSTTTAPRANSENAELLDRARTLYEKKDFAGAERASIELMSSSQKCDAAFDLLRKSLIAQGRINENKAQTFLESSLEAQKTNTPPSPSAPATIPAAASSSPHTPWPLYTNPYPAPYYPYPYPAPPQILYGSSPLPPLPPYVTQALNREGRGIALIKATEEENIVAIRYLLGQDTAVDSKDGQNRTPLLVACQKRNEAIIVLLLDNGAPVDGDDARAALIEATRNGHRDVVKILVNHGVPMMNKMGPRPTKDYRDACTPCIPLQIIAENGDVELLQFFLATQDRPNGLKLDATHLLQTTVRVNALQLALGNRKLEVARLLVRTMKKDELLKEDLLYKICQADDLELLSLIWKNGMPLYQQISNSGSVENHNFGEKLLIKACSMGKKALALQLLERGVDLDKCTFSYIGSWRTLRCDVVERAHLALAEFIKTYRCNGRQPQPMQNEYKPC